MRTSSQQLFYMMPHGDNDLPKQLIHPQVVAMANQPRATCDQALKPPSGAGPGSVIDFVVKRDATRLKAVLATSFTWLAGVPGRFSSTMSSTSSCDGPRSISSSDTVEALDLLSPALSLVTFFSTGSEESRGSASLERVLNIVERADKGRKFKAAHDTRVKRMREREKLHSPEGQAIVLRCRKSRPIID